MEQLDAAARALLGGAAGGGGNYSSAAASYVPSGYVEYMGSQQQHRIAMGCSWSAFALSLVILVFYAWHSMRASCGWEEVYVCFVELVKTALEIFCEPFTPATITQARGTHTTWLRYAEWLLTCPVLLIHLSNLTGLQDNYSKRTMLLLVSDIGTIVMGVTAAFSSGPTKIVFFCLGCLYAAGTFVNAGKIYFEGYHAVPAGQCRTLVKAMAWTFFLSWAMFPLLFLMGPEGFGHLTPYESIIGHTCADLLSKNLWGLLGHHLRNKVRQHIVMHGDVRKPTRLRVAGTETQVDTFVDDDAVAGAVRHPASSYLARRSFVNIRDTLQAQGVAVRASLDGSAAPAAPRSATPQQSWWALDGGRAGAGPAGATAFVSVATGGAGGSKAASPTAMLGRAGSLRPAAGGGGGGGGSGRSGPAPAAGIGGGGSSGTGPCDSDAIRVVLAAPDDEAAEQLRMQVSLLPLTVEVVTAVGPEQLLALAAWAAGHGGADCCLLHADCLWPPTSAAGDAGAATELAARLQALGHRVCIWGEAGGLFEAGEMDGCADTPDQLTALLQRMRGLRCIAAAAGRGRAAAAGSLLLQSGSPASPRYASPAAAAAAGDTGMRMPAVLAPSAGAADAFFNSAPASPTRATAGSAAGALTARGAQAADLGSGLTSRQGGSDAALLLQLLDEVAQLRRQLGARGE